jgi:alpha-tubulin suppressor-like RCC1 family protein
MALKNNTWKINQWYDQAVAGNISYTGQRGTLFGLGRNHRGQIGNNEEGPGTQDGYSSPVQVPGTTWHSIANSGNGGGDYVGLAVKTDGTLWSWGYNEKGQLGQNDLVKRSSPTQIGGGTDWVKDSKALRNTRSGFAIKTDGTLWSWGYGNQGALAQNNNTFYSSPVQIPGTTWSSIGGGSRHGAFAIKTDGTLWGWGANTRGALCISGDTPDRRSSPIQIPGSTWDTITSSANTYLATKTDGTMWSWGNTEWGEMGTNASGPGLNYSSPVQIPGTTWAPGPTKIAMSAPAAFAIKTDGTLWAWGNNTGGSAGYLGLNNDTTYSSPVQVGSDATWNIVACSDSSTYALKTDGTLWAWGNGYNGRLGQNQDGQNYSSPKQIGSLTNWIRIGTSSDTAHFLTHA